MKKLVMCSVFAVFCGAVLFAQNYKDGFYFAQDENFTNNQKNQVVIEVKGGKIASANWNIQSLNAGTQDLKTIARAGNVPAAVTWAAQAKAVEDFLVSSQNINATSVPNGPANVKPFFDLVKKALGNRSVAITKGSYKDGWYYAIEDGADEYHTKNYVLITVVNGTIVDVLWNGVLQGMPASVNTSKLITSMSANGTGYPMPNGRNNALDPKKAWHIQAPRVSEALVKAQNPDSIKAKPDGKPDAISGVTIEINHFLNVSKLALQSAK